LLNVPSAARVGIAQGGHDGQKIVDVSGGRHGKLRGGDGHINFRCPVHHALTVAAETRAVISCEYPCHE
jgi:hypothetical protein